MTEETAFVDPSARRLAQLLARARENEAKLRQFQALELELVAATTVPAILDVLESRFARLFAHDLVRLVLADPDHELRRLLEVDDGGGASLAGLELVDDRRGQRELHRLGNEPWLGGFRENRHRWLVGTTALHLQSLAILPMSRGPERLGVIVLGSRNPWRFVPDAATDFLHGLAAIAGLCLDNAVNLHRLRVAGLTNPLTGVRNRRFFDQRLREEVSVAQRTGRPLGFLFADIDYFKRVNDELGHAAGDRVLREVARRVGEGLRLSDTLSRYGGEEFAVLMPDTDRETAALVAERIRAAIDAIPFSIEDGGQREVTLSVGVAVSDAAHVDMGVDVACADLSERADKALYRAKHAGRNRVEVDGG